MTGRRRTRIEGENEAEEPAEAAVSETPEAPVANVRAPVTQLPDRTLLVTAERHFVARMSNPLVLAFLHEEQLRGGVRRISAADWDAAFQAFTTAPR